jgi:hypothetical protein
MDKLNINKILNRTEDELKIKNILMNLELNKNDLSIKKGIYIFGESGTGKTTFVMNLLKDMNYDVIRYDAGDIRNKSIIDTITNHNMSDKNVMSMFQKNIKKIAFVMDEIDGMNNGDKGGINTLIKIIRPKKTKKQKLEEISFCPIICIGNYHIDKKIKELIKVCNTIELNTPSTDQIRVMVNSIMPELKENISNVIINYVKYDLRKIMSVHEIYKNDKEILNTNIIENIFQTTTYNDDTKKITQKLINSNYSIDDHIRIMNDTDRTIVGLLWHENIIDVLGKYKKNVSIPFYLNILNNICFADYIDRVTFQKQIWQFNEMSSLIKTFKNNKLYNDTFIKKPKYNPSEVRFTKVLTKYSTEYNNYTFIQNFCQQLNMDKKDIFSFFLELKSKYDDNTIINIFENYEITKLDINRMYRYLDKLTKEDYVDNEIIDDKSIT